MAYVFKSRLFSNNPDRRLVDAADHDPGHIMPGSSGDHVSLIQQALFNITGARIKTDELGRSYYGPSTAEAVASFKRNHKPPILNYANQIDNIVGIKTMRWLDEEQFNIEQKNQPQATKLQDIVVHILGQDPSNKSVAGKKTDQGQTFVGVPPTAEFNQNVETAEYLAGHEPLIHQQWNGGLPQFGTDPTDEIVNFINAAAGKLDSRTLGRVVLIGMSSGGRNAVTVAGKLAGRNLLTYVAAIDAAFNNAADPARFVPVSAGRSENFFQTIGNDVLPGAEWHGSVAHFRQNIPFDSFPAFRALAEKLKLAVTGGQKVALVNTAHIVAVRHGYTLAKATALGILK